MLVIVFKIQGGQFDKEPGQDKVRTWSKAQFFQVGSDRALAQGAMEGDCEYNLVSQYADKVPFLANCDFFNSSKKDKNGKAIPVSVLESVQFIRQLSASDFRTLAEEPKREYEVVPKDDKKFTGVIPPAIPAKVA
ncbi:hypothetical protein BegalDRAFT_3191 [Beggiatoa alba B18LD]|uniref:Uncharacterized protein n=1 Tax=Beggiatoa alba B18LD TaxID=395493 RepID=I3CK71_9GAMM|nr:hypothetical protein [Beggiatoa alba]EIJ44014.1 hypothetical protein BegalDRAFT_3191 [Beggiatoa alba B18LD]